MKGIEDLPDNYKDFKRMRRRVLPPVNAPTSLPSLPADTEPGTWVEVQAYFTRVLGLQDGRNYLLQAAHQYLGPRRNSNLSIRTTYPRTEMDYFAGLILHVTAVLSKKLLDGQENYQVLLISSQVARKYRKKIRFSMC